MCMVDGSWPWTLGRTQTRTAAKEHRCGECRRTIGRGERYEHMAGLMDGQWWRFRTCAHCVAARQWLLVACSGWCYEMTAQDLREHVDGDKSYLRSAALTRLVRWQLADWRDRQGQLRSLQAVREVTGRAIESYLGL